MLISTVVLWVFTHKALLGFLFLGYSLLSRLLRYYRSPLVRQGIPGPRLAAFTSWYRALHVHIFRNFQTHLQALHAKYGPVIQISPNEVSVSDPRLRGAIYSFADERQTETFFAKSRSFETGTFNDDFNFVFEQDPARARLGKKAMSHAYSERALANYDEDFEAAMDELVNGLRANVVSKTGLANLSHWCLYFWYDLAAQLSTGKPEGFCRAGCDFDGAIKAMRVIMEVVGGLIPIPFALDVTSRSFRGWLLGGQLDKLYNGILGHRNNGSTQEKQIHALASAAPNHFLSHFSNASARMRELYPTGNFTEAVTNNLFFLQAGSTVAANNLPLLLRNVFTRPDVLAKIRAELATLPGRIHVRDLDRTVHGACAIPYTEACVLEALRLHPTFAMTLPRIVPAAGCQLNEFTIPPGYNVGMSGAVVNVDTAYFGADAAEFRPERWLGDHPTEMARDGSGRKRSMRSYLEAGWFAFGAGARVCVGRHLALIAAVKVLGRCVQEFDIEVVKEPSLWYGLILHTEGLIVKVSDRAEKVGTDKRTFEKACVVEDLLVSEKTTDILDGENGGCGGCSCECKTEVEIEVC
ncbi:cytochrome P450 [Geopyxis carbonaria]|nr:cytochrome P450 [Geopyxis carbonaria]